MKVPKEHKAATVLYSILIEEIRDSLAHTAFKAHRATNAAVKETIAYYLENNSDKVGNSLVIIVSTVE